MGTRDDQIPQAMEVSGKKRSDSEMYSADADSGSRRVAEADFVIV